MLFDGREQTRYCGSQRGWLIIGLAICCLMDVNRLDIAGHIGVAATQSTIFTVTGRTLYCSVWLLAQTVIAIASQQWDHSVGVIVLSLWDHSVGVSVLLSLWDHSVGVIVLLSLWDHSVGVIVLLSV